jgi:hypothetical protein
MLRHLDGSYRTGDGKNSELFCETLGNQNPVFHQRRETGF